MFRVMAFLTKRDGLSTEDFMDHYENRHAPLILRLASAPQVYRRSYRGERLTRHGGTVDFDAVTELGFADRAAYLDWVAQLAAAGGQVAADEALFLDRSRTRAYVFEDSAASS
jgi:hypothetical protein